MSHRLTISPPSTDAEDEPGRIRRLRCRRPPRPSARRGVVLPRRVLVALEPAHLLPKLGAAPRSPRFLALVLRSPRMRFVARDRRCTGVLSEEDPVSGEALVHHGAGLVRIQRPPQTDHLIVDQRVHRIKDDRPQRLRPLLALVAAHVDETRRRPPTTAPEEIPRAAPATSPPRSRASARTGSMKLSVFPEPVPDVTMPGFPGFEPRNSIST